MRRLLLISVVLLVLFSCGKSSKKAVVAKINVSIEYLLKDSLITIRALELKKDSVVVATATGKTLIKTPINNVFEEVFTADTIYKPNFRALACTADAIFTISIANPALLYKNGVLVYKESSEKVFYDAIAFWNRQEGIAIGDSTDGCLSIIITRNAGETWEKIPCERLPKGNYSAFAASDTNIAIVGNKTWVATGGTNGAVMFSGNKGGNWERIEVPMINKLATSGMYSIAFYDEQIGFAIGGDYSKPKENVKNKIRTLDGGKTWELVANGKAPGYRSCVQFVPNSNGEKLVAVGFEGVDYSNDFGKTWQHVSDASFYTIRFLNDSIAYAAGKGSIAKIVFN